MARKRIAELAAANGFGCATPGTYGGARAKSGSRSTTDPSDDTCSRRIQGNVRAAANPTRARQIERAANRQTIQTPDRLGAIHGREIVRVDRWIRAFPRCGVFREIFVRAQSDPAGITGCDRVRGRCRPCCWRFASETERERCHCTDALRDRHPGALCGDLCLSGLLSLRVLWSDSNVSVDDTDHGGRVSAFRPVERYHRRGARDRGWISHTHFTLNEPG